MAKKIPAQLSICITAYKFPILGRATDHGFLWPIAKGLAMRGHKVTVIAAKSPLGKQEVVRDGVRVFYLHEGFPNYSGMRFEQAVYKKFRELRKNNESFDLVHSIDRSGFLLGKNKKGLHAAMAYDAEATQMSQLFSILSMAQESARGLLLTGFAVAYKFLTTFFGGDRELLKTADGVFVTSPQQRITLERYYLYPDYHIYTVPYGVELSDLSQRNESIDLRKKWNLPEHAHIVLTQTDMTVPQEIVSLLEAFERVAIKKPNAYMVIIGNGPAWKEVQYNLLMLALGSRVIMTGSLTPEEISDWLSISEVYVNLSARTTGFEPTMIEAMAQKKLIIGSEMSPISNVIEEGKDGFLLRPADRESLSQLLLDIFSGALPTSDITEKAREKVTNLFDTKKMVHSIEDAYRNILTRI